MGMDAISRMDHIRQVNFRNQAWVMKTMPLQGEVALDLSVLNALSMSRQTDHDNLLHGRVVLVRLRHGGA